MIISIGAEKASDGIQHPFIMKTPGDKESTQPSGGQSEHHAGPSLSGVGDGDRVCPGKCPLGASVRSVFKQIARSQKLLQ